MPKNQSKNIIYLFIGVAVLIIIVIGSLLISSNARGQKLAEFAQCLKDRGAVFYGTFWCPHCQSQKALFGSAKKYLPYIECSTPDGAGQLAVCQEKNITGYPTWIFADGSIQTGEMSLDLLSQKTGCVLP